MPRGCSFEFTVDVVDVLYAFGFQPLAERRRALLGVNRNTLFPGGAPAEDTVELHSRFAREFKRFAELRVAYSGRQINERLGGNVRSFVEQVDRFFLAIRFLPAE